MSSKPPVNVNTAYISEGKESQAISECEMRQMRNADCEMVKSKTKYRRQKSGDQGGRLLGPARDRHRGKQKVLSSECRVKDGKSKKGNADLGMGNDVQGS
jgi:hypothetical protein